MELERLENGDVVLNRRQRKALGVGRYVTAIEIRKTWCQAMGCVEARREALGPDEPTRAASMAMVGVPIIDPNWLIKKQLNIQERQLDRMAPMIMALETEPITQERL